MLKNIFNGEIHGWVTLIVGVFMFFCAAVIGEIGKIGDWLFGKKED